MINRAMTNTCKLMALILTCAILLLTRPASSQGMEASLVDAHPAEASAATADMLEDSAPGPIPIEDLPAQSEETDDLLEGIRERLLADSTLLAIRDLIPSASEGVNTLCTRSVELLDSQPTLRRLRNLQSDWHGVIGEVGRWQESLSDRISAIGSEARELAHLKQAWRMTGARAGEDRLPGEVVAAITRTISDIGQTEDILYERRNELLLLDFQVAELVARCRNRTDVASAEADRMREKLLVADAAPLWSPNAISEADDRIGLKVRSTLADHIHALRAYIESDLSRVGLHLAVFIVSAICIALLGSYARAHADGDGVLAGAAEVLRQPIPAAVLIAILVDGAIHAHPPGAWTLTLDLLLLVPLLAMVPRLVDSRVRVAIYFLAAVYLLEAGLDVLPQHSFAGRILKLGVKVTLMITAIWLMRRLYLPTGQAPGRRRRLATLALGTLIAILLASAVAGVVGNVSLSTVLLEGTLGSVYLGILMMLGVLVLRNIVTVILRTGLVKRTNLVRRHGDGLRLGILTALNFAGALIWLAVTFEAFKVLSPTYQGIKRALASTLKIGSLEIATGDIVLFFFIVWLSFLISRILRAILKEEVYPRVRLAHGVSMAISKLAHYAILLIGFFFALGAAGIDFNRFTLLAGALGVGIGFGLQDIINNIVSGLIVLFERPVQIGDKVRIGTNEGEIRRIGLRASVLRTWEGAEVIVPNSRLILDEVTNWTLSDQQRRVEINVGVAYGSDTDKVSELLLNVAKDHDDVLDRPEPFVLFTDFGESSLNFSLRAWTARFGDFFRVRSELTAAVNKALAGAGITIPFPQHDVHMRSGEKRMKPDSTARED